MEMKGEIAPKLSKIQVSGALEPAPVVAGMLNVLQ